MQILKFGKIRLKAFIFEKIKNNFVIDGDVADQNVAQQMDQHKQVLYLNTQWEKVF